MTFPTCTLLLMQIKWLCMSMCVCVVLVSMFAIASQMHLSGGIVQVKIASQLPTFLSDAETVKRRTAVSGVVVVSFIAGLKGRCLGLRPDIFGITTPTTSVGTLSRESGTVLFHIHWSLSSQHGEMDL